jgi:hypothetical protein
MNNQDKVTEATVPSIQLTKVDWSDWSCHLFGYTESGIKYIPKKGEEPNWFWRKMQYLILGHKWVKEEVSDE